MSASADARIRTSWNSRLRSDSIHRQRSSLARSRARTSARYASCAAAVRSDVRASCACSRNDCIRPTDSRLSVGISRILSSLRISRAAEELRSYMSRYRLRSSGLNIRPRDWGSAALGGIAAGGAACGVDAVGRRLAGAFGAAGVGRVCTARGTCAGAAGICGFGVDFFLNQQPFNRTAATSTTINRSDVMRLRRPPSEAPE